MKILVCITTVDKVREYKLKKEGAKGVKVKYSLLKGVGATQIQLDCSNRSCRPHTSVEPCTQKQGIYIKIKSAVKGRNKAVLVTQGSIIFILSNEEHQF